MQAIDDDLLSGFEELVDDGAEEKDMDDRPKTDYPFSWSEVGLLDDVIVNGTE